MDPVTADRFDDLFLTEHRLLDVRAPVEFARGALPGAVNLPLLDDGERAAVGTRYKAAGQQAAIALGHQLVCGRLREARTRAWAEAVRGHPRPVLYCFRGGLRSRIAAEWSAAAGAPVRRIEGGWKAVRSHLCRGLEARARRLPLILVGGRTGCAKTRLLTAFAEHLDLEGRAHHRGSAFGRHPTPQPAPIDFEHALAVDLLRLEARRGPDGPPLVIEDESKLVGRLLVPPPLFEAMGRSPVAQIVADRAERVENLHRDYIVQSAGAYVAAFGEAGLEHFFAALLDAVDRIRKRLGGAGHRAVRGRMEAAIDRHRRTGDDAGHRAWIDAVLERYYDRLYDWQLEQKAERIVFRGTYDEVRAYLAEVLGCPLAAAEPARGSASG